MILSSGRISLLVADGAENASQFRKDSCCASGFSTARQQELKLLLERAPCFGSDINAWGPRNAEPWSCSLVGLFSEVRDLLHAAECLRNNRLASRSRGLCASNW